MQQKTIKIIAILLVTVMLYTVAGSLVSYAAEKLLTEKQLESQGSKTNNDNVDFDVYFENQKHSNISETSKSEKVIINLNVKNAGYLKNATVDFSDGNFLLQADQENEKVEKFNSQDKKVTFNQINAGENVVVSYNAIIDSNDYIKADSFNKDTTITLNGTYTNNSGKEIPITAKKVLHKEWQNDANLVVNQAITKYIPYVQDGTTGIMIQQKVNVNLEENKLPVKIEKLEVTAPEINNEKPEEVIVVANTTKAVNGEETAKNFNNDKWTYDQETGIAKIMITNLSNADGNISWKKNSVDEYTITYIYSSNIYNAIKDSGTTVDLKSNVEVTAYNNSEITKKVEKIDKVALKDKIGDIVEVIPSITNTIGKGYMINNKVAAEENKKETEYSVQYLMNVGYSKIINKITLEQQPDSFMKEDIKNSTSISGNNYAYDKSISLSKNEFDKIIGQDGNITLSKDGTVIAVINKDSAADVNGNINVDLTQFNVNNLTIETTKPQTEGNLLFTINKALTKNTDYSLNQINSFSGLNTTIIGKAFNDKTEIASEEKSALATLTEPTQKAEISLSRSTLSTIIENTDVDIKAVLRTSSIDDKLFSNPTLKIDLPTSFENIDVKNVQLLFEDELTIESTTLNNNDDGTKSLYVKLNGKQTKFNNVAANGTTVLITADITVNKFSASKPEDINMTCTSNSDSFTTKTSVELVAPTGVVTTNSITNFDDKNAQAMSISGEEQQALVKTQTESKEATFNMNVINNYDNTIDNIVVVGKTPFKGNKDLTTNSDLGSTIDLNLTSGISIAGLENQTTTYYSENESANNDLSNAENGWTTDVTDFSKIKSYMLVAKDATLNKGEGFSFSYKANIPANLQHNESAFSTYSVLFENNQKSGEVADIANATKVGVTTGTGPVIEATLESKSDATLPSGSTLNYELTVKNTGTETANNVSALVALPSFAMYESENPDEIEIIKDTETDTDFVKINLGTININETKTQSISYSTMATAAKENQANIMAKINVGDELAATTNTVTNTLSKVYFTSAAVGRAEPDYGYITPGNTYKYTMKVMSSERMTERTNAVITITLPNELSYVSTNVENNQDEDITSNCEINQNGNKVTIKIPKLSYLADTITIRSTVNNLPDGTYKKDITTEATAKADGTEEEKLKSVTSTVGVPGVKLTQTCNIPSGSTLKDSEELIYEFTLENLSSVQINDLQFVDYLPEQLQFKSLEISYSDTEKNTANTTDDEQNPSTVISLKGDSTATIKLYAMTKSLDDTAEITNKAEVKNDQISSAMSNSISHKISPFTPEEVVIDEQEITRKITGTVWIDKNNNGKKDTDEQTLSGIKMLLLDNNAGNIAVNNVGEQQTTSTSDEGTYMFSKIPQGKYTVIFLYDSGNYSPTEYHKDGVEEDKNSDAIDNKIQYEGAERVAAVTEEIVLADADQYNVDLGLVENPKFDLSLEKKVKTITATDKRGSKVHEYNNDLAKIEFESKYVNDATMIVEYSIVVKNEGGVAGYAKKIADYMPSEMKFSAELNKDWYQGKDGTLYNSSLSNTVINPGESKEITLILTKKMSEDSFGLINNIAEIYEESNDYGLSDMDSTPGNKATNEDDTSSANVLTSVKTGQIIIYSILAITVISIIAVGTYMIKKKVLK